MKIIKVVHSATVEQLELQKQAFAIQTFDVAAFVKMQTEELNVFNTSNLAGDAASMLVPGYFIKRMLDKHSEISAVIQATALEVVKDIQNHLEKVELFSLESAKSKYPRTQNLSVGTYTLHPFDGERLTRLENYHTNLAMEKDDELIILLGKMGAKTIKISEAVSDKINAGGKLEVSTIYAGTEGQLDVSHKMESGKDLLVSFEGNSVEIDPNLLNNSLWFATDSRLYSIFESRRFNPNKIEEYTLRNTYTETFDFDFELAGKYLTVKTDLTAKYNALSQKIRQFHVSFSKKGVIDSKA